MRISRVILSTFCSFGYLGIGILFFYIEWNFLHQNSFDVLNPLLHLQALKVLLTTPLFWIFLAIAVVSSYALTKSGKHREQNIRHTTPEVKRPIITPEVKRPVTPSPQPFPEELPTPPTPIHNQPSCSSASTPDFPNSVSQPTYKTDANSVKSPIELLEWAIQSSQNVKFAYHYPDSNKSDLIVNPINIKTIENSLHLEGYCRLTRTRKTFLLKYIRDIKIIPSNEPSHKKTAAQAIKEPRVPVQSEANSTSPSIAFNSNQTKSTDSRQIKSTETTTKQRPYINYQIEDLEKLAHTKWNDARVLTAIHDELIFRSRKKALDLRQRINTRLNQLQNADFKWATTTANPGSQKLLNDTFKQEKGLLSQYGYKVGMKGLPEKERWKILDTVLSSATLPIEDVEYLREWGQPNSAKRLKKLADSIATFTRNAKRRKGNKMNKAIQDWESDLAYLKRTYYNNRFKFQYPRT